MSNGCEELGRLTVGLKEEEARELAMHATGCARDEGDERNGVIVSVLSAVGVDFLGSTLLQGSIYVERCGVVEGPVKMKLPTQPSGLLFSTGKLGQNSNLFPFARFLFRASLSLS